MAGSIWPTFKTFTTVILPCVVAIGGGFGWSWEHWIAKPDHKAVSNSVASASAQTQVTNEQVVKVVEALPDNFVKMLADAHLAERNAEAEASALSLKLSANQNAVITFFQIIGQNSVPAGDLRAKLVEVAESYIALRHTVDDLISDQTETSGLFSKAVSQIANGHLHDADKTLFQAEELTLKSAADLNAKSQKDEYQSAMESVAEIRAARGDLALTMLEYVSGTTRYQSAADAVSFEDTIQAQYRPEGG